MSRVGLLGGTFNPPHNGHLHAAVETRRALHLDAVWFVPDAMPPHKALPIDTPSPEERLAMTRLAADTVGGEVCTLELTLPAPSYTARTVSILTEQYPDDTFWWIVGSDMLLMIQNWVDSATIFRCVRIAALARHDADADSIAAHAEYLRKEHHARVDLIDVPPVEVSSTAIRDALRMGICPPELPGCVYDYIRERGLYT